MAKHEEHDGKIDDPDDLGNEPEGTADLIRMHPAQHNHHSHRWTSAGCWEF